MPLRPPAGFISANYDPLKNPNAPTSPSATAGDASASVSFTPPTNVGGSAVTAYYAVSNPGQITGNAVSSPVSVTGLTNGTNYTFTVWALNSYGPSAYSTASGSVTPSPPYIEDVFSTWLYTGNGSTQTITNGIDLSTNGGLVWLKTRSVSQYHYLFDTSRGPLFALSTNATDNSYSIGNTLTAFNANGFNLGLNSATNGSGTTFASWTFRKQPKFFDVVTYTGNDTSRSISHNLGSVPGCIIVKNISQSGFNWVVYHRSTGATQWLKLNLTDAVATNATYFPTDPTSTTFAIGSGGLVNNGGDTFVAYLFAHNAGGFGLTGADNVISCGSFTVNGSGGATVNLGYEPQWVLFKRSSEGGGGWFMEDIMRGMPVSGDARVLFANTSQAEAAASVSIRPTSTGFTIDSGILSTGDTFIYIAIRRGPMKTPTTGTSVYNALTRTGTGATSSPTGLGFPPDAVIVKQRSSGNSTVWNDKLRGPNRELYSNNTDAEFAGSDGFNSFNQNGFSLGANTANMNDSGATYVNWALQRAPGFFDVVCYTGTGSARTVNHNLGVAPEMMILKPRSNGSNGWCVYSATVGNTGRLLLDTSDAAITGYSVFWNNTTPTSTVFSLGTAALTNESATTFVAYLFATCAGVSKVGSYTGTGTTLQIDCGFTGGARLVIIKRTDSTGDWYVWDSARGIVAGNDPYLLLNSTAAEVTNTDYVDTYSAGFEISSTAPAAINANGGSFVFLAVA